MQRNVNELRESRNANSRVLAVDGVVKWHSVGYTKPKGVQLKLSHYEKIALDKALQHRMEFTQVEMEQFGMTDLRSHHFVESDGRYFQPLTAMQLASYDVAKKWTWFLASEEHHPRSNLYVYSRCQLLT